MPEVFFVFFFEKVIFLLVHRNRFLKNVSYTKENCIDPRSLFLFLKFKLEDFMQRILLVGAFVRVNSCRFSIFNLFVNSRRCESCFIYFSKTNERD